MLTISGVLVLYYRKTKKVKREKSLVAHWISFKRRENFRGFNSSDFKGVEKAIAQEIQGETFAFRRKSAKHFSRLTFVVYGIYATIIWITKQTKHLPLLTAPPFNFSNSLAHLKKASCL